ncbi:molybdenum cofactor biosynthesis protein B [Fusobacterium sp.]|uniref:MogA/MoaB family molybdenum cofactor biosynthesis protein n=1 Tax=Fusobacterium sp. TaxID=68766 RepID=UPI00396C894D
MFRVAIISISDRSSRGERADMSTEIIQEIMVENRYEVSNKFLIPDEYQIIKEILIDICDNHVADIILTTGGTGFSPRDVTPEATEDVIERRVPGIPEAMRTYSMQITRRAMFSRATAGIRKKTLIINLPGSPKAVRECLEFLVPDLKHGLEVLSGEPQDCGVQK